MISHREISTWLAHLRSFSQMCKPMRDLSVTNYRYRHVHTGNVKSTSKSISSFIKWVLEYHQTNLHLKLRWTRGIILVSQGEWGQATFLKTWISESMVSVFCIGKLEFLRGFPVSQPGFMGRRIRISVHSGTAPPQKLPAELKLSV